jgi:hypothetical protein
MGSTLDPGRFPHDRPRKDAERPDVGSLGPSDSSDTGADRVGLDPLDDTSDRRRTGERASVDSERQRPDHDIGTDRVVGPEEAGLGRGLDEAGKTSQDSERGAP